MLSEARKEKEKMPVYKDVATSSWYTKFYYEDWQGIKKQKFKRGFATKREALAYERNFLESKRLDSDVVFGTLCNNYLEYLKARVKPTSYKSKINIINKHIRPYFEHLPLNNITSTIISKWQTDILGKQFSNSYMRSTYSTLKAIINHASVYYGLSKNPCKGIKPIGSIEKRLNFWTIDEYKAFIAVVDKEIYKTIFNVLFFTGMRLGECMALTLKDIDFINNTISINKTYTDLATIQSPKTKNSIRTVVVSENLINELKLYTEKLYGLSDDMRIFPKALNSVGVSFRKYIELSKSKRIVIHGLRHSHVSLLIELGFSVNVIAERIGDTVQTVNNIYSHLYPNKQSLVADTLNKLL